MPRRKRTEIQQPQAIRAAVYTRVSTDEQAESGLGIAAQRARCLAMAEVKGWADPALYSDEGVSGTKDPMDRPAMRRLLEDVAAGRVQALIVLSLDRLGRRTRLILDLVERLATDGCELVSCKESLDTTTATGRFVLTLFAGLAQLERDQIAERTSAALQARGKMDGERGGRLPFGYRREGEGRVSIDEATSPIVRRIFEARHNGATLQAIADALNGSRTPTPQGGARWTASSVLVILRHRHIYQGGQRGDSPLVWPAILL